ncbi:hypothetical protein INR49_030120 [Caranx melampygus]|nr:hypothetical protein INR49_030120 [Caranx melampygus]
MEAGPWRFENSCQPIDSRDEAAKHYRLLGWAGLDIFDQTHSSSVSGAFPAINRAHLIQGRPRRAACAHPGNSGCTS